MSHFDNKAREWDSNPVFQERGYNLAKAIASEVPLSQNVRALDYGCGTGLLSFPLKNQIGSITLADSSAGMLAVLREKIALHQAANMRAIKLDLLNDPLPDARFDLIYTSMTLHHVPQVERILTMFFDLLTPGGHLCVADLDQEDGSFHGPEFDVHPGFDRDELAQQARNAGFDGPRFRTVLEILKEQPQGPRSYPVFLMTTRRSTA